MSPPPHETPIHQTTGAKVAVAILLVVSLAYALLIAQQILLWVFLVVSTVVIWYAARLVVAMERIANNLERLTDETSPVSHGNE